jgi:lipopolysaccharide transport system permease protein
MPDLAQRFSRRHDLWWQFTVRAVEMRHRGSYLGMIWTVLNPLMMLALYVGVFGYILRSQLHAVPNETPVDYALAIFLGIILFHVTSETIAASPTYVIANPNLVKKVVFPLDILPLANTSALWFHFLISFALLLVAAIVTQRLPSFSALLWMPLIFAPQLLLTMGLSWFLAALGVFFRDISQIVAFASQVAMWTSGVFFSVAAMQRSALLWSILKWNPLLHTIEQSRRALLWNMPVDPLAVGYTWCVGVGVFFAGAWFFKKLQPAFADVI